jgi:hypothetical protein
LVAKKLISQCPVCDAGLAISRLTCDQCDTQIDTRLGIPAFLRLPPELQAFVMTFLACRGNIREAEKVLGISYPTVCKRLDAVNELLGNQPPKRIDREAILEQLERGEITASEATQLLKGR